MSKTALTWILFYSWSLVATWIDPVYGLLGIMAEYYRRPGLQWWHDELPRLRWNFIVTAVFAASVLLRKADFPRVAEIPKAMLWCLLIFAANVWVVTLAMAVDPERAYNFALWWTKVAVLMPLLLLMVLRRRRAIDLFIIANIVGVTLWGWDAYTDPKREAARLQHIGSGDTYDDNSAAMHLLLILPLIISVGLSTKSKLQQLGCAISTALVVNTLILCNSRGAMLGLFAGLMTVPLLAKRGHRARSVVVGAAMVGCVLVLADPQFLTRQATIFSYEEDGSATGRIAGWKAAGAILSDHPLGVGGRGFHVLIPKYSEEIAFKHQGEERAPHNTYIMVTVEYGVIGITLWLAMMAIVLALLYRTRTLAIRAGDDYFYYRSSAVLISLVSVFIAASFTDRVYSDGLYWIVALAVAVYRLARTELAGEPQVAVAPAVAVGASPLVGRQPRVVPG